MSKRGLLIVLSGPSGVGKGTVRGAIFKKNQQFSYSISATTRPMRPGERDGIDYFFKSREEFIQMIDQGKLLEYAEYVGNFYGTPLDYVNQMLDEGQDVFLEIEVQGALQVKEKMPDGIFIFLSPPNQDELRLRIESRGTEKPELIDERLNKAKEELELMKHYDYVVVNDTVDNAVHRIESIILSEHLKIKRVLKEINDNE
ncbi:guanylate kinase [Atopobacter phocae]|uniref:guanylate kinase n=1 Tax=Atopobacter phocae TaxID=136492 RepID=UPI0004714978|nr:guanylate kinase [Atopobacter phocae]